MKTIITLILSGLLLFVTFTYRDQIQRYIFENVIFKYMQSDIVSNDYTKENDIYYKNIYVNTIDNKHDLINSFYTILNSGMNSFDFLCNYDLCKADITTYTTLKEYNLNNYVHPFNSYNNIAITVNNYDKITLEISHVYTDEEIVSVNTEIDKIISEIITDEMSVKEKIKVFHDYIINKTKYDEEYINSGHLDPNYYANKATGPLFYNKAICGGYTDVMAIFLDKLGLENHKLSTNDHIWNYVLIDDVWYNLDLTWDDPITNTGEDVLLDTFFLITEDELKALETKHHDFILQGEL